MNNVNVDYLKDSAEMIFDDGADSSDMIVHDDGAMSVSVGEKRYCFLIGQEVSPSEYNRQANQILKNAGINHKVSGRNN